MEVRGFEDTIRWYDENAEAYADAVYKVIPVELIEQFLASLPAKPKVLDAGCGPGEDARVFYDRGAGVVGVDMSKGLLSVARKKNPDIRFIEADIRRLPLEASAFDGVWAHASLVHFEKIDDVLQALSEFHRVLKPGGVLHVFVKAQTGKEQTSIISDSLSNHERFYRYFEPMEMKDYVERSGFTVTSTAFPEDLHGRSEVRWLQVLAKRN